ncbi:MAG: D-glycerate dehydrogenase [Candidatus Portnoybacteria bacterium]|nr:D-glycerate dehydrogenase [Candidatus Portnoybacteria bacterium]
MPKVFITRQIPEAGPKLLREAGFEVEISDFDGVLAREVLLEKIKGADAVLSLLTDKMDAAAFEAAGAQLKIVANYAVGYDNIDVKAAGEKNIIVTNTPGVLTESVAEHAVALMLAIMHRVPESDKFMREGEFIGWAPMLFLGNDLAGKTEGLVGLGRIGARVAEILKNGFGAYIIYADVKQNEFLEKEFNMEYKLIDDLLKEADVISLHVPMNKETNHLISVDRLKMMKKNAYLINTSRGPVIDEISLVDALKSGLIKGAALDVFEGEPKTSPGLAELPNVVMTPHTASATEETRGAMSELAAKNIIEVLSGRPPLNQVKA